MVDISTVDPLIAEHDPRPPSCRPCLPAPLLLLLIDPWPVVAVVVVVVVVVIGGDGLCYTPVYAPSPLFGRERGELEASHTDTPTRSRW